MARYRISISGIFDSYVLPNNDGDNLILHLVRNCCPGSFGLNVGESCSMTNCMECWGRALEMGVKNGCKSVHVERLD